MFKKHIENNQEFYNGVVVGLFVSFGLAVTVFSRQSVIVREDDLRRLILRG